jgi:hypothetical protein
VANRSTSTAILARQRIAHAISLARAKRSVKSSGLDAESPQRQKELFATRRSVGRVKGRQDAAAIHEQKVWVGKTHRPGRLLGDGGSLPMGRQQRTRPGRQINHIPVIRGARIVERRLIWGRSYRSSAAVGIVVPTMVVMVRVTGAEKMDVRHGIMPPLLVRRIAAMRMRDDRQLIGDKSQQQQGSNAAPQHRPSLQYLKTYVTPQYHTTTFVRLALARRLGCNPNDGQSLGDSPRMCR